MVVPLQHPPAPTFHLHLFKHQVNALVEAVKGSMLGFGCVVKGPRFKVRRTENGHNFNPEFDSCDLINKCWEYRGRPEGSGETRLIKPSLQ